MPFTLTYKSPLRNARLETCTIQCALPSKADPGARLNTVQASTGKALMHRCFYKLQNCTQCYDNIIEA